MEQLNDVVGDASGFGVNSGLSCLTDLNWNEYDSFETDVIDRQ
jgi:hypothetical protein